VVTLSIAIVTYKPDTVLLTRCLQSLRVAIEHAAQAKQLSEVELIIIDNSSDSKIHEELQAIAYNNWNASREKIQVQTTEANLGYGKAHNLAIRQITTDYHLVLNPDVILDKTSLGNAIHFMKKYPNVVLLTPSVINASGMREYLNKRYPDFLTLLIRGFAPNFVRALFVTRIAHYEMRDHNPDEVNFDILLASGCFMLFRTNVLKLLEGFSDKFFLYFEDYDLSLRTHDQGKIAYVPSVKIIHFGGGAARKGFKHIFLFIRSSITFFNRHGWRRP
jgi:GT2 family glycosyltransferase